MKAMSTFYDKQTCKRYLERLWEQRKELLKRHAIERQAMNDDIKNAKYHLREAKAGRIVAPGGGWGD